MSSRPPGRPTDRAAEQDAAFAAIASGRTDLTVEMTEALSGLDAPGRDRFRLALARLDPQARFALIERLISLEQGAPVLDFAAACLAALTDEDATVRALAASGLADYEGPDAIDPLLALARDDPDDSTRAEAVVALGPVALRAEFGQLAPRQRDAVVATLRGIANDTAEDPRVRAAACASVAVIDEPWVRDLIFDHLEDGDPILRLGAVQAMGRTADPYWIPTLENSMAVLDDDERATAAVAAGEIADEDAVPALSDLLDDESGEVVLAAVEALGEIGGPEALEQLARLATHPEPAVRAAVQAAAEAAAFADDPLGLGR